MAIIPYALPYIYSYQSNKYVYIYLISALFL